MEKTILIDGREVRFKATANTPRLYRLKFRRDMLQDMAKLAKSIDTRDIRSDDIEILENAAYIMALQADEDIGDKDGFVNESVYGAVFDILELWNENMMTITEPKNAPAGSSRQITAAMFYLRCLQLGLSISDLDLLSVGMVIDILFEHNNDSCEYETAATQADFDNF